MIVNFSPKNTCKNYNINNFNLPQDMIVDNLGEFNNCTISGGIVSEKSSYSNAIYPEQSNIEKHIVLTDDDCVNIEFLFDQNNKNLSDNLQLEANKNSNSKVVIKYVSNIPCYHNGSINICTKDGAKMEATIFSLISKDSLNMLNINLEMGKGSFLKLNIVDILGATSTQRLIGKMENENSTLDIKAIYLLDNNKSDYNYMIEVNKEGNNVDMQCVGVLCGEAKKSFKGTIEFKRGAKHCHGEERELCLPLSDNCVSLSSPMILCSEEDVDISHATSIGRIDDKTMFYMNSRGIDSDEAQRIYVLSQMSNILKDLNEDIKNELLNKINGIDYEK